MASRAVAALRAELAGCAWLVRLLLLIYPRMPSSRCRAGCRSPSRNATCCSRPSGASWPNVAGPAGTLLLLDDLHWAGADACDLLASLLLVNRKMCRCAWSARTARPDVGPAHPLVLAVAEMSEAQMVTHHTLHPLSLAEAQALFVRALGERESARTALAAQVAQRAGGVPFYLMSYARSVQGHAETTGRLHKSCPGTGGRSPGAGCRRCLRLHARCWARRRCWVVWSPARRCLLW